MNLMSSSQILLVPGAGTGWDKFAEGLQQGVLARTNRPFLRRARLALSGEGWFGHPLHPAIVAVPAGAWLVSAFYDAKSVRSGSEQDEKVADTTLTIGLIGAVPAALSGIAQFLDTKGQARRVAAAHWALNATAVTLYGTSIVLRSRGLRTAGRRLSAAGLAVLGPGAYLGGELVYRLGVGQVNRV